MQISVLTESDQAETRVAITPDVAKKIIVKGVDVVIQSGCGEKSNYTDQQYEAVGAKVTRTINESVLKSDILITVKRPEDKILQKFNKNTLII